MSKLMANKVNEQEISMKTPKMLKLRPENSHEDSLLVGVAVLRDERRHARNDGSRRQRVQRKSDVKHNLQC